MRNFLRFLAAATALPAASLGGCLAGPSGSDDPVIDPIDDGELGLPPSAYYTLTAADLRDEAWPAAWTEYDVFVCTAFLPEFRVAQAKADRPDAIFLAYTAVADMYPGSPENPYWEAFHAVFDSSRYVRDLTTDTVVRLYGADGTPGSGHPYFVMQKEHADILVAFHRDVTLAAGFHGLYLDNCNAETPQWRLDRLREISLLVDIDADGFADPIEDIPDVYATWRPYYTEQLRAAVGPSVLLVANSGGGLDDAALNGITLEGVGDRFEVADAYAFFGSQRDVGVAPFVGVAWVTTHASDLPTRNLLPSIEGLRYGFVEGKL